MKVTFITNTIIVFFHDLPEFKQKVEFVKGNLKKIMLLRRYGFRNGFASFLS